MPFFQRQWQGEVALTDTRVRQIGQVLGEAWPQAVFGFSGQYYGQWTGPIELTGHVNLREAQIGTSNISRGSVRLERLFWPGTNSGQTIAVWPSVLRTLVVNAHVQDLQSIVRETSLPLVLQQGTVALDNQTLTVTQLQGRVGVASQLLNGEATITELFGASHPALALQLTVRIDLAKDVETVLALLPTANKDNTLPRVVQTRGYALAQLRVNTDLGLKQNAKYEGEVTLQDVALRLPTRNVAVTDIAGVVHLTSEALTTTSLIGRVGNAPVAVQGKIQNYQSNKRVGELQLTFTDIPDQTVAPLFPERIVLASNGTLSGKAKIVVSPGEKMQTSGAVRLNGVQLDPLKFLRPFTIAAGELNWQGQKGVFTVTKGQLESAAFSGRGRFSSIKPLHLDLSLDFPTLDVLPAVEIDRPRSTATQQKPTTVVKANLTCGECTYKTVRATNLSLAVYWHDRQAEVDITTARVAGGAVKGEVTLWPDLGALFFAPHLTGVDVQSFFRTVGKSSNVLTDTATGSGKVYVENWRRWANPAY
jgi:hypothetical protein